MEGHNGQVDEEPGVYDIYELVPCAPGVRTSHLRWVLHWKFKNGAVKKNKARLITHVNHQRPCIDYSESLSPVCWCGPPMDLCASGRVSHAPSFP